MNKEEYTKFVENNELLNYNLELASALNTVVQILINKNMCNLEEFKDLKQQYKNQLLNDCYAKENQEDLKALKTFNYLFSDNKEKLEEGK